MLEKRLSVLLATYLNNFVCDLNEEQLQISLWSGEVVLRHIQLRANILDQLTHFLLPNGEESPDGMNNQGTDGGSGAFPVPFRILKGTVSELIITIPWTSLEAEPVMVEARAVEIVVTPLRSAPYDAEEEKARARKVQVGQLKAFEKMRTGKSCPPSERIPEGPLNFLTSGGFVGFEGYMEQLTETIKQNICIALHNVRIKYVFDYEGLAHRFTSALSVVMEKVRINTTNTSWTECFVVDPAEPCCKKVVMSGVRLSLHAFKHCGPTDSEGFQHEEDDTSWGWSENMEILKVDELAFNILVMRGGNCPATPNRPGERKVEVSVTASSMITIRGCFGALRTLAIIRDSCRYGFQSLKYRKNLHLLCDDGKENVKGVTLARRRWWFAIRCILDDICPAPLAAGGRSRFIKKITQLCALRREYCSLWKRTQGVAWLPHLTKEEESRMNAVEELLHTQQIIFFRCLTYAELRREKRSMSQQKRYIEDAMRRNQPYVGGADSEAVSAAAMTDTSTFTGGGDSSGNTVSNSSWLTQWWFASPNTNRGTYLVKSADDTSSAVKCFDDDFEEEWVIGRQFLSSLQMRRTDRLAGSPSSPSWESRDSGGLISVLSLSFPSIEAAFYPQVWSSGVSAPKPLQLYVDHLQQHLFGRLTSLCCSYTNTPSPCENRNGLLLTVDKATVSICGPISTPLLEYDDTYSCGTGRRTENCGRCSNAMRKSWLTVTINETRSRMSVAVAFTRVVAQPWHEWRWWCDAIKAFGGALLESTNRSCNPSKCQTAKTFSAIDICVDGVIVSVPLASAWSCQRNLTLCVNNIYLSKLGREPQVSWKLVSGVETPISIRCTGTSSVLTLWDVVVVVTFEKGVPLFGTLRAELTVEPLFFAIISDHLSNLSLLDRDTLQTLLQHITENGSEWRLESDTVLSVGNSTFTFPASQCRNYLAVLYQYACDSAKWAAQALKSTNEQVPHGEVSVGAAPTQRDMLFMEGVELVIYSGRVIVQDVAGKDVGYIDLPHCMDGGEHHPSVSSLTFEGSRALKVETSISEGGKHMVAAVRSPELHVCSPCGQYMLVLENFTAKYVPYAVSLSLKAVAAQVVICSSLVCCVEVLLGAYASLWRQSLSASDLAARFFGGVARAVERDGALPNDTETSTKTSSAKSVFSNQVVDVDIGRLDVRFCSEEADGIILVSVNDLVLQRSVGTEGDTTKVTKVKAYGALAGIEYMVVGGETMGPFVLFSSVKNISTRGSSLCSTFKFCSSGVSEEDTTRTHVSFDIIGGCVHIFYEYWVRLLSLYWTPSVMKMFSVFDSHYSKQGFLLASCEKVAPAEREDRRVGKSFFTARSEISGISVFVATDATQRIDFLKDDTFITLDIERITLIYNDMMKDTAGNILSRQPFRLTAELQQMRHLFTGSGSQSVMVPFISRASAVINSQMRLVPGADKENYVHVGGGSNDLAILLNIDPSAFESAPDMVDVEHGAGGVSVGNSPTRDAIQCLKLTPRMLASFIRSFLFNFCEVCSTPKCPHSAPPDAGGSAPKMATYVLSTVSPLRCTLIEKGEDDEEAILEINTHMQLYSTNGTAGGEPSTVVRFDALSIDDATPSRRVLLPGVPHWQQQQVIHQTTKGHRRRLIELGKSSISRVTRKQRGPLSEVIVDCFFDNITVFAARHSCLALLRFVVACRTWLAEWGRTKRATHLYREGNNVVPPATTSVLNVLLRRCAVHLEEPSGEPLVVFHIPSLSGTLNVGPLERKFKVALDESASIWSYGEATDAVRVTQDSGQLNTGRYSVPALAQVGAVCLTVIEPFGGTEGACSSDLVSKEETHIHYTRTIELSAQSVCLNVDSTTLIRLLHFGVNESSAYVSIVFPNDESGNSTCEAGPGAIISELLLSRITVVVRDALFYPKTDYEVKRVQVERLDVSSGFTVKEVTENNSGKDGPMHHFTAVYTAKITGAAVGFSQLPSLSFPNVEAQAEIPIAGALHARRVWDTTATSDNDEGEPMAFTSGTSSATAAPPSMGRLIRIGADQNVSFVISISHIRELHRTLRALASSPFFSGGFSPLSAVGTTPVCYSTKVARDTHSTGAFFSVLIYLPSFSVSLTGDDAVGRSVTDITASEAESKSITTLMVAKVDGVLALASVALPGEGKPFKGGLTFHGSFELSDGDGNVIVHRQPATGYSEVLRPLSATQRWPNSFPSDVGLQLDIMNSVSEQQVRLQIRSFVVALNSHTVDFLSWIHCIIDPMKYNGPRGNCSGEGAGFDGLRNDVTPMKELSPASFECSSYRGKQTIVKVCIKGLSLQLEQVALLNCSEVRGKFGWGTALNSSSSHSIPYEFSVRHVSVVRVKDQLAFFEVAESQVRVAGAEEVSVAARGIILNNYNVTFYICLWARMNDLWGDAGRKLHFPTKGVRTPVRSIDVTIEKVNVRLFPLANDSALCSNNGSVDLLFPAVEVKNTADRAKDCLMVKIERASLCYKSPSALFSPLAENVSFVFSLEKNLLELSRHVSMRFGNIELSAPLGDVLESCSMSVLQATLPLMGILPFMHNNEPTWTHTGESATTKTFSSDTVLFYISFLSVKLYAPQSGGEFVGWRHHVLFGVDLHQLSFERERTVQRERVVARVLSITSAADSAIQSEFITAIAPENAEDSSMKRAIYIRRDVCIDYSETCREASVSPNLDSECMRPCGKLGTKVVSYVARLHALRLVVSPKLCNAVSDHVLRPISVAAHRTLQTAVHWFSSCQIADRSAFQCFCGIDGSPSVALGGCGRLITISGDVCLCKDLLLGGKSGFRLRFVKGSAQGNPINTIFVRCIGSAKVILAPTSTHHHLLESLILVDSRLTVVFQDVPFIVNHGKVADYVVLGEGSFCVVPDGIPSSSHSTAHTSIFPPSLLPLTELGWCNVKVSFDVLCGVTLLLCSNNETVTVFGRTSARYEVEKKCYEGASSIVEYVGESGSVKLSPVSVRYGNSLTAVDEPSELIIDIQYHRGDRARGGISTTQVNMIVPPVCSTVPLRYLLLMGNIANLLRKAFREICSIRQLVKSCDPRCAPYSSEALGLECTGLSRTLGQDVIAHQPVFQTSFSPTGIGGLESWFEFGLVAPHVEFVITDDFTREKFVLALTGTCIRGRATRNLSRGSCKGYAALHVTSCQPNQPPCNVVSLSPEFTVEYTQHAGDGYSLQGLLMLQSVSVTLPLITLARLTRPSPSRWWVGVPGFCNNTGVPLTLVTVLGPHNSQNKGNVFSEFHALPNGKLMQLSDPQRTFTSFRIVCGFVDGSDRCCSALQDAKVDVDILTLRRVTTHRIPFTDGFAGLLDIVLRYDEVNDVVNITTPVTVRNELTDHLVSVPDASCSPLVVPPKETRYMTFTCLRQPLSLLVGEEWRFDQQDEFITLELLISAFVLLSSGEHEELPLRGGLGTSTANSQEVGQKVRCRDTAFQCSGADYARRGHMRGNDVLVLPLWLTGARGPEGDQAGCEYETFGVLFSLRRKAFPVEDPTKSRLMQRCDVELCIRPMITVLNNTGGTLAVVISTRGNEFTPLDEPRFVQCGEEYNNFTRPSSGEGYSVSLSCQLPNGVRLTSSKPTPLNFSERATVGMKVCTVDGDETPVVGLVMERVEPDKFVVRVPAVLVNMLPFPIRVADKFGTPLLGEGEGKYLAPKREFPILMPLMEGKEIAQSPEAPVLIRVMIGSSTPDTSGLFACNDPMSSECIRVVDGEKVHLFRARRCKEVTDNMQVAPRVCLEPMWILRNQNRALSLAVRCLGLDTIVVIPPQSSVEWTTFAAASATDPLVQVCYVHKEVGDLFVWSNKVRLLTLSTLNVPIVMKHYVSTGSTNGRDQAFRNLLNSMGVITLRSLRVPPLYGDDPIPENFACLSIVPNKRRSRFLVDFDLDGGTHIVVENRTNRLLIYEEMPHSLSGVSKAERSYIVQPFTDSVTCFESDDANAAIRLTLHGDYGYSQTCTINLDEVATACEGVKVAPDMFVLCTLDCGQQKYHISVTGDRSLESALVFRPQRILHLEVLVHTVSLYVASKCVPKTVHSLLDTPLAPFVTQNKFHFVPTTNSSFTDAQALSYIQCRELDLILMEATGIYCTASLNQRHCFGRMDVGRVAVVDCTTPEPVHPVVVLINTVDAVGAVSGNILKKPCLSLQLHVLVPERRAAIDMTSNKKKVKTIRIRSVSVKVAPVTVKVSDTFLFLLQQAACCLESEQCQMKSTEESYVTGSNVCKPSTKDELSTTGLRERGAVNNYHIATLEVSPVELEFTITRRKDGLYDPFAGLFSISRFIPSVERAPLSINGISMEDINQRSNSVGCALLEALWPLYRNQLALQFPRIVGSMEVLGNPIALLSGWKRGVRSLLLGTAEMNMLKGLRDFLCTTTSSTLHSVGLISHAGSRTAANFSWDNEWLEQVSEGHHRVGDPAKKGGVLWGMGQGLRDGIAGVFSRPLNGVRTSGLTGFVTGVATGAVGLITRPVAGILGGVGNTAEFYAKVLQEPDATPNIHPHYLESGRNFKKTAVRENTAGGTLPDVDSATFANDALPYIVGGEKSEVTCGFLGAASCESDADARCNAVERVVGSSDMHREVCNDSVTCADDFVSYAAYESVRRRVQQNCSASDNAERLFIESVGAHNYALRASWSSFVTQTTTEEFYRWLHVALASLIKDEIHLLVRATPSTGYASIEQAHLRSSSSVSSEQTDQTYILRRQQARDIRKAIGTKDLLKYVSAEQFAGVCTLEEIKQNLTPEAIKKKLPPILPALVRESVRTLLTGDYHGCHASIK
ncbi:hypothetical protein, conserved [Trypanosoma brucei gambiense DAL972]|uniref:Chorein N-terminal domain-containing protein n=1 Tax=Trypanosoma brucei gambiense (strain MHOM/CI/86/DAL972) TaxID=679716 RepID=D0A2Y0_TRYB9|nr:hypothetical protein, conserved [Trypanosoma brucei gambiense DAL972]CBH15624.1 hypothetical protein, conserved [Trypanosoma brucei gambiense DAL972]|eukprot:XP_011777888.1 hypothetical protein, conserved [Trypanosoma brucei gambiense DAL972]